MFSQGVEAERGLDCVLFAAKDERRSIRRVWKRTGVCHLRAA